MAEEQKNNIIDQILHKLPTSFVSVILLFVALGNFNDSFEVINRAYEFGYSLFSNQVYYKRLEKVKVGLNSSYLQNTLGIAQLVKRVGEDTDVNYYFEKDFMLAVFESKGRIEGYYVVAFKDSFAPNVSLDATVERELWGVPFDEITPSTDTILYDFSKNNSYYLESTLVTANGLSQNIYLGWTSVANKNINQDLYQDIEKIVELELTEDDSFFEELMIFRASYAPNFYGYGNIEAELVQKSLLTNSELLFYAGIS